MLLRERRRHTLMVSAECRSLPGAAPSNVDISHAYATTWQFTCMAQLEICALKTDRE